MQPNVLGDASSLQSFCPLSAEQRHSPQSMRSDPDVANEKLSNQHGQYRHNSDSYSDDDESYDSSNGRKDVRSLAELFFVHF